MDNISENPTLLIVWVVLGLIAGYFALRILFFCMKKLLSALGKTAAFLLGFAIVTLLDLKFVALAAVTLCITATMIWTDWNLFALAVSHYLILISLIYLPISLMARDRSKQIEASDQVPRNVAVFFASFGISSGLIGLFGLILGFSLTFYMLDRTGNMAFGAAFDVNHYFLYAFNKLLESFAAADVWANLLNNGQPVSTRFVEPENIWAQLLNMGFVLVTRVWVAGLGVFILIRVFRPK